MDIDMQLPSGYDVGWFPEDEHDHFEPEQRVQKSKTVYVSKSKGCKWVWPVLR